MTFSQRKATLLIPDGAAEAEALGRVTHLAVGAHPDDIEFMALHGILACYGRADAGFGAITCTDGAGSSRTGIYAACTDADMIDIRRREQDTAGRIGGYRFVAQLGHPSTAAKTPGDPGLAADLDLLLAAMRPTVVYTHNPADKHDTHVGVMAATLAALRRLPASRRPANLYGCEVWRDLDWLCDDEKVMLDVGGREHVAAALMGVFDSQIAGGKRYDLATAGRRRANATYAASHAVDTAEQVTYAMDLTPLLTDPTRDVLDYVAGAMQRFQEDVRKRLAARLAR